ncbi:hypothetical protein [Rhizobium sp. 18055]|jgi:hypothetical protein|uniref:hypothetical protein n=1 Tax=Rhizobium sp. 18055 TaxID=2681403 RepID=UPI001358A095|nr:hypothetical protein [Rhizobium sp. 18055]
MPAKPNVKILRIDDPDPVEAPLGARTDFKLIGYGFSDDMHVYISTKADGSDDVDVALRQDKSATRTEKVWPLTARPGLGALSGQKEEERPVLWIVIKLNGALEDSYQGFILV